MHALLPIALYDFDSFCVVAGRTAQAVRSATTQKHQVNRKRCASRTLATAQEVKDVL